MRNKSSVFAESALKCMVSLPPFLFQNSTTRTHWCSWTLGDQFLWNVPPSLWRWNPIFRQVCSSEFRTTSFHHKGLGMSSVLARISPRNSWRVRISAYTFLNFLSSSNRCHWTLAWRRSDLQTSQVQCFDLASFGRGVVFWTISNEARPGKIFHSNSICSPSTPNNSLYKLDCRKCSSWFSIWSLFLNVFAPSPSIRRNLSRRVPLLLLDVYLCFVSTW